MNKIGNKVDVPFGKLLTRILEGIFFSLAISGGRATLFGFLLAGKGRL